MTCDRIDKSVNILGNFFSNPFIHKWIDINPLDKVFFFYIFISLIYPMCRLLAFFLLYISINEERSHPLVEKVKLECLR